MEIEAQFINGIKTASKEQAKLIIAKVKLLLEAKTQKYSEAISKALTNLSSLEQESFSLEIAQMISEAKTEDHASCLALLTDLQSYMQESNMKEAASLINEAPTTEHTGYISALLMVYKVLYQGSYGDEKTLLKGIELLNKTTNSLQGRSVLEALKNPVLVVNGTSLTMATDIFSSLQTFSSKPEKAALKNLSIEKQ